MKNDEQSGIDLLEESIRLLRRTPADAWLLQLAGSLPFFAGLFWFFYRMTGNLSAPDPLPGSLLLTLLFVWRQISRTMFAVRLYEEVSIARVAARTSWLSGACLATTAGFARMLLIWLPIPWFCSVFRLFGMMVWTEDSAARAFARSTQLAGRGRGQFTGILLAAIATVVVWLNLLILITLGIAGVQTFTGAQLAVARTPQALLSWPFLMAAFAGAWILVDALLAAFHALQRFYGESRETGADLLQRWRKAWASAAVSAAVLLCLCGAARAAAAPPDLDRAIDQVLTQPQYQWREVPPAATQNRGWFLHTVDSLVASVRKFSRRVFLPVRRMWDRFMRWLRGVDFNGPEAPVVPKPVSVLRLVTAIGIVLLAGGLVAILLRVRFRARKPARSGQAGDGMPVLDLSDPGLVASDLPEQEWLRLARESMERGDARSALRALFLAMLSQLGARRLIVISRYKSNLDYARELARRGKNIAGLDALFRGSARRYESAWYGTGAVGRDDVEEFIAGLERLRGL